MNGLAKGQQGKTTKIIQKNKMRIERREKAAMILFDPSIIEENIKTDGFVDVEKIEYLAAIPPEVGMAVK